MEMINVFVLQLEESEYLPDYQNRLLHYLPEESRLRTQNHTNPKSRLQSVAGELLARYAIRHFTDNPVVEINIHFGEKGKPFVENLTDIHFNISHSGDYVVCAVSVNEVGIDVERKRKVNLRIAERYFSPAELLDLMKFDEEDRMNYFITLWTIKESYLKAIGEGLTQHLNSFTVTKNGDTYLLTDNDQAQHYGIRTFKLPDGFVMAVCSERPFSLSEMKHVTLNEIIGILPKYS